MSNLETKLLLNLAGVYEPETNLGKLARYLNLNMATTLSEACTRKGLNRGIFLTSKTCLDEFSAKFKNKILLEQKSMMNFVKDLPEQANVEIAQILQEHEKRQCGQFQKLYWCTTHKKLLKGDHYYDCDVLWSGIPEYHTPRTRVPPGKDPELHEQDIILKNTELKQLLNERLANWVYDKENRLIHAPGYKQALRDLLKTRVNLIEGILANSIVPAVDSDWEMKQWTLSKFMLAQFARNRALLVAQRNEQERIYARKESVVKLEKMRALIDVNYNLTGAAQKAKKLMQDYLDAADSLAAMVHMRHNLEISQTIWTSKIQDMVKKHQLQVDAVYRENLARFPRTDDAKQKQDADLDPSTVRQAIHDMMKKKLAEKAISAKQAI